MCTDTDAVVVEGRSSASGALIALGALHGFAARLDLELIDPADIPGGALMPADLPTCDVALTPASLRTADVVDVRSPDGSLTRQLRNRPFGAEPVGSEPYGFMVANVDGPIAVTCDDGDVQISLDATVQAGWNVMGVRSTAYEEGVLNRLEGASSTFDSGARAGRLHRNETLLAQTPRSASQLVEQHRVNVVRWADSTDARS